MRKFYVLGVLLLLVLGVTQVFAQDATAVPTAEATAQAQGEPQLRDPALLKDDSLTTTDDCSAPCWHGITPGTTSFTDAVAILQAEKTFSNVQTENDPQSSAKVATWEQTAGVQCCQLFSDDGVTVSIIFLRTSPDTNLGQVIDKQGEPAFALGSQYSDTQAIMNLIYPDKPMVVYAFVAGTQGDLSADSEIIGMLYMTAKDMTTTLTSSNLYTWKGYKNYQDYTDAGPNFDVTPSVSATDIVTGAATPEATPEATAAS